LAGGVFRHPGSLLRQTIVSMLPGAHPVATEFEPAAGALLLAFDAIARTADTRRLRDTMPRSEFFASHATGSGGPGAERLAVTAPAGVQA
jgi:hypothetical protein